MLKSKSEFEDCLGQLKQVVVGQQNTTKAQWSQNSLQYP